GAAKEIRCPPAGRCRFALQHCEWPLMPAHSAAGTGSTMTSSDFDTLKHIRVDHTGALRAPKRLRDAAEANRRGELPKEALDRLREEVIADLIHTQERIGLPVVTDGELRRKNFQDSFYAAVDGFDSAGSDRSSGENVSEKPFTRTTPVGRWRQRVLTRLKLKR